MSPDDLVVLAYELLRRDPGRPKQASLKRAVSTAYYALFHAVAHECISQTIGWSFRSEHYWTVVATLYRAVDHGTAKKVFNQARNDGRSSNVLKQLARAFVDLQSERIRADYDPEPTFRRRNALQLVIQADDAIQKLRALPTDTKRELAVQVLSKQR